MAMALRVEQQSDVDKQYALYRASAEAWLDDWGFWQWQYRDRDSLGYPRINVLHEKHGVGSPDDMPDMPARVQFIDRLWRCWSDVTRAVAWVTWVDESKEQSGWQREVLKRHYNCELSKEKFRLEVACIIAAVASAIITQNIDAAAED